MAKNPAFHHKRTPVIFNSEGADARDTPAVVCAIVSTMDKCIPKLITNQGAICDFTIAVGQVHISGGKNINWPGIGSCGQGYYVLRCGANTLCG